MNALTGWSSLIEICLGTERHAGTCRACGPAAVKAELAKPSSSRRKPRAILFDLDGTLDDRARSIERYAERFHAAFAHRLATIAAAELATGIQLADGDGYRRRDSVCDDLLRSLPWLTAPDVQELVDHWYGWFPRCAAPREGLLDLLEALHTRGTVLGVVTNGGAGIQQAKLEQLGIGRYLSTVVISGAIQVEKPDPRIFMHALAEIGCSPAETWFVGDHPVNDVLGAQRAGLQPVWLRALHP